MYICEVCGTTTGAGVPCNVVPVEIRKKVYPEGSTGYETVREVDACPACVKEGAVIRAEPI
jgi:hypothetical protein